MTDRPKRTTSEPAFVLAHNSTPATLPAPSSEVPPAMTILDVEPAERAAMLRRMREAETMRECKICSTCPGCHGTHMVTLERARQIASGEVDDPETTR